jgi:gamma-glutamyl phosphate reductase
MAVRARSASRQLQVMTTEERVAMLNRVADALLANEQVRAAAGWGPGAAAGSDRRS